MAFQLAVGTIAQIASSYATSKTMSAVSNANPAVATLEASHGVAVGDYIEVSSGWSLLDGRIVRVSAVATNDVTLEGVNTLSATLYPTGSGGGSVREISTWANITQLAANITFSGGDQQYADITTLQDRTQRQIPTVRTPVNIVLPIFYDESLPWVSTVRAVSDASVATGLRLVFPGASRMVGNAFWNLKDSPTIEDSTLRTEIALTFSAKPINYAT